MAVNVKVLDQGVLAARPDQMYGWPGITRAANGDILVSASERKTHGCPYGREVIMRSTDNGFTWTLPMEVFNSELDDRDPNLLTLPDGKLILSWFTDHAFSGCYRDEWPERSERLTEELAKAVSGTWFITSDNNGLTWDKQPKRMPCGMRISPILLEDGSWLTIGFMERYAPKDKRQLVVWRSWDQGESWQEISKVGDPAMMLNENHVIDVGNGRLLGLFRKCNDYLRQAWSEDGGYTWSEPEVLDIWGYPAQMIRLANGDIMMSYGHRRDPYSIRCVFSHDNGKSWDTGNTYTVFEWQDEPDMGYPSTLEVAPGEFLTVFYCSRRGVIPYYEATEPEGILYTRYTMN